MKLTKEQKNCPYCHYDEPSYNQPIFEDSDKDLAIGASGDVEIDDGNSICLYCPDAFNYCPMCRQPLNKEED